MRLDSVSLETVVGACWARGAAQRSSAMRLQPDACVNVLSAVHAVCVCVCGGHVLVEASWGASARG
eukprot:15469430-Alexandrium_andersonii.AAC.1